MQEELNTRLLQKISYLEKGAVLGMIVCSCFFLAAILYFVKANVYVILISGLKKKVAHVGIYLKNGKFIHSSTSKGVIVSNLNESYDTKHWISGGRIR